MKTIYFSIVRFIALPIFCFTVLLTRSAFSQSTPAIIWSTNGHDAFERVTALAFSGDGALLVSGASDQTAKLWSVSTHALVRSFSLGNNAPGTLLAAAVSADGAFVGAGSGVGGALVWRVSTGQRLWMVGGGNAVTTYAVSFGGISNLFCWGKRYDDSGGGIQLAYGETGASLPLVNPNNSQNNPRGVYDVRLSPDGTLLASGNEDNTASLFRVSQGTLQQDLVGHSQPVMSVDFSPDGKMLATSAKDGTARLWNTTNGALVRIIQGGGGTGWPTPSSGGSIGVGRVRFSADGKTLLASSNGMFRFWRVADGTLLLTYSTTGNGVFAVSPDGKHFAYGTGTGAIGETNSIYLARMPLFVTGASVQPNGFQLEWQGGTGLYQVEQRTNGLSGPWEAINGPTTNTNLSLPLTNSSQFFRIKSVETPP